MLHIKDVCHNAGLPFLSLLYGIQILTCENVVSITRMLESRCFLNFCHRGVVAACRLRRARIPEGLQEVPAKLLESELKVLAPELQRRTARKKGK